MQSNKSKRSIYIIYLVLVIFSLSNTVIAQSIEQADALFNSGNYAGARAIYQQFVPGEPTDADAAYAQLQIGRTYISEINNQAAIGALKECVGLYPDSDSATEAIDEYGVLVDISNCQEISPPDSQENMIHGKYLLNNGLYSAARAKYQYYLENYSEEPNCDYVIYQIARSYYKEKNYSDAVTALNESIREYSRGQKLVNSKWLLGYCYLNQDETELAYYAFERITDEHPGHKWEQDSLLRLATLEHKLGVENKDLSKWEQSKSLYKQIRNKYSNNPEVAGFAQMHIGALSLEQVKKENGSYSEAMEECGKVLSEYSGAAPSSKATATLMMGEIQYLQRKYTAGLDYLNDVLSEYDEYPEAATACAFAQYLIGQTYRRQYNYESAIEAYEAVIRDYDTSANFRDIVVQARSQLEIGRCYYKQKDYESAKTAYELVGTMYPDSDAAKGAAVELNILNKKRPDLFQGGE